jgi:hypothetical protein
MGTVGYEVEPFEHLIELLKQAQAVGRDPARGMPSPPAAAASG